MEVSSTYVTVRAVTAIAFVLSCMHCFVLSVLDYFFRCVFIPVTRSFYFTDLCYAFI